MKNILVVLNGEISQQHVTEVAISIAKKNFSRLHAVFLNHLPEPVEYDYFFANDLSLTQAAWTVATDAEQDNKLIEAGKQLFADMCVAAKVSYKLETIESITMDWLIEQTAFSDLLVTDVCENIEQYHITDLLSDARCPIYLVSKDVLNVKHVVLTYDGSFSSIHAIKQYAQIFPDMKSLPVSLVHIAGDDSDEFPREKNIKSWLPAHYSDVEFKLLHGDVREELIKYVNSINDSLVVMGSFGRSQLSRLFHKSLANALITEGKSALFISHK